MTYFEQNASQLLKERKLTQTEFANRLGIQKQNVKLMFKTKNVDRLSEISKILGVSVDMLINGPAKASTLTSNGYFMSNGKKYVMVEEDELVKSLLPNVKWVG